jgi:phage internal scaffolding protein
MRKSFHCSGPSRVRQQFKKDCDMNSIMSKFKATGLITHTSQRSPQYGDFSNIPDYAGSLEIVLAAQAAFNALPSKVRARFKNDPATFVEFASDAANGEELIKLGLAQAKVVAVPETVPAISETPKVTD